MRIVAALILCLLVSASFRSYAQVSSDEAAQRLAEKEAARRAAAATQPDPQIAKLQEKIAKLQEQITKISANYEQRIDSLKRENARLSTEIMRLKNPSVTAAAAAPSVSVPDGGKVIASYDSVQVILLGYGVDAIALTGIGGGSHSTEKLLYVKLRVVNTSQTKKIGYTTWRGTGFGILRDFASATDNFGNVLKRIDFGLGTRPEASVDSTDSVYPGKSMDDTLIFETPVSGTKTVTIELPAENVEQKGDPIKADLDIH